MVTDLHAIFLLLLGFVCGLLWGMHVGREQYRRTLVLIANAGSAEKLPNGQFYYLKQEGGQHGSDT